VLNIRGFPCRSSASSSASRQRRSPSSPINQRQRRQAPHRGPTRAFPTYKTRKDSARLSRPGIPARAATCADADTAPRPVDRMRPATCASPPREPTADASPADWTDAVRTLRAAPPECPLTRLRGFACGKPDFAGFRHL
jgi:hypothetical protein